MRVLIIGGMAAGPKTAARLRRLLPEAQITMVEQGEYISFGSCGMPFYVAKLVPQFDSLYGTSYGVSRDSDFFLTRKDVQVLTGTRAFAIDRVNKKVLALDIKSQQQYELDYDYLVLTTGAQAVSPPIKGIDLPGVFFMHQPHDAEQLKAYLHDRQAQHVTIIGAGVIGMEMADALAGRRLQVTMCEAGMQVLPKLLDADMARLVARQMQQRKVELQLSCQVQSLNADEEGRIKSVTTTAGEFVTDAVIVATGVRPRVDLAKEAGLQISSSGAIKVDTHLRTSDPSIFAAGDCAAQINSLSQQEVYVPLASTANKQGRVVADNIAGLNTEFDAVMGTTVLQAFDLNIGKTGLGEQEAVSLGIDVISGIVSGHDAPHYYPVHDTVTIKLMANRMTGQILGAQVCGIGDGIKRLDVLTTAMKFGASLKDIANLDLGYAPPYSEAIDVAIHAANMLENKRTGQAQGVSPSQLEQMKREGQQICFLDIREPDEVQATPLKEENVLEIPFGELRDRYQEIPPDQLVAVYCGMGVRSYDAACFLHSKGLQRAAYIEGGRSTWW